MCVLCVRVLVDITYRLLITTASKLVPPPTPSLPHSPRVTRLPVLEDQDLVVSITSNAQETEVTYFAIWCRSNNVSSLSLSLVPRPLPPSPPENEATVAFVETKQQWGDSITSKSHKYMYRNIMYSKHLVRTGMS